MNDPTSTWLSINTLIIVSEIALVFAVMLMVIFVLSYRKRTRMKLISVDFLEEVKNNEVQREQALKKKFADATSLEGSETDLIVEALVNAEKKAYLHVAQLYMGYKPESLIELEEEIKHISENYIGIIEKVSKNSVTDGSNKNSDDSAAAEDDGDDSAIRDLKKQVSFLREEKKTLKLKNAQLQVDFSASVDSIERMTTEFANMYEGGSKDGEKRIKNEMYQLRQILAKKMDATSVEGDFNSDIVADGIPDMDISEDAGKADDAATK